MPTPVRVTSRLKGTPSRWRSSPFVMFLIALLAVILSLLSVISAFAMPVEARRTEAWYAYTSSLNFNFSALVTKNKLYPQGVINPEDLVRQRLPVEPPAYRRVVLSQFVDALEVSLPYQYKADRPTNLSGTLRMDGILTVPGLWQKPYPVFAPEVIQLTGSEISGVKVFRLPVKQLLAEMESLRTEYKVILEPMELTFRPVFEVEAEGLKKPVKVSSDLEFKVSVRSTTIEIDDVKENKSEKTLSETMVVPVTMAFFGRTIEVGLLRQISLVALSVFLLLAATLAVLRRKKPDSRSMFAKLGPGLIHAKAFELPEGTVVVDVRTGRELIQLHAHSERPVVRAGRSYYLVDGTACYRYTPDEAEGE